MTISEKLISNSSRVEPQKFDVKIEYESSSEDISTHDDENNQEITFSGDAADELIIDDNLSYSSASPIESSSKKDNILKINIKEVTYDKPINNEIRIKEILPVVNYDITFSTKSPTFPREVTYTTSKEAETDTEVKNDSEDENFEAYQTPPILRIGDKLLYLGQGDLVPENSSLNTPAPVFTVIGAEGLQRVIEDPEEFESKFVSEENQDDILDNNIDKKNSNGSFSEKPIENDSVVNSDSSEEIYTTSEDPDKILQEVISDLYETTTVEAYNNELKPNFNRQQSKIEATSSEMGSGDSFDAEQTAPSIDQTAENESQAIPIDHLPEHNPEYPPIPEDITNFGIPEDTSETVSSEIEFSGAYPIAGQEVKNDDKPIIDKQSDLSNQFNSREKSQKGSEKIVPEILQMVRQNQTNSSGNPSALVPPEWLKNSESAENVNMKNYLVENELPENVSLSSIYKESTEEDDAQDYIFVNYSNSNLSSNAHVKTIPSVNIQDDKIEPKNNLRSPGEPLLIPEWERNKTVDVTDSEINVGPDLIIELNENQTEILSNDTILINLSFEKEEAERIEKEFGVAEKSNSTDSQNIIVAEISNTENLITKEPEINMDTSLIDKSNNSFNVIEIYNESVNPFSDDTTENTFSSTTNSLISSSTENVLPEKRSENIEYPETIILSENPHNQKQKKSSISMNEVKNGKPEKKGNILADLISLVGDVAAIGDNEAELSTVHNSIDNVHDRYTQSFEKITSAPISSTESNKIFTDSGANSAGVEITEENFNDKTDIPLESDKVEFTTKKTYIDNDGDERIKWKSTDGIMKDIEIIPKVETKVTRLPEKIIDQDEMEDSYSDELSSSEDFKNLHLMKEVSMIITKSSPESSTTPSTTTTSTTTTSLPVTSTTTPTPTTSTANPTPATSTAAPTPITSTITPTSTTSTANPTPTTSTAAPTPIKSTITPTSLPTTSTTTPAPTTSTTNKAINTEKSTINTTKKADIKPLIGSPANVESVDKISPTVMKVSTKSELNKDEDKNGDKLTKRETNSQIVETTGQIDESLITILRDFFGKTYRQ